RERGGLRRFLPSLPKIRRAEYSRPQMARLRRHQHHSPLPRVERHVMNDVAQKDRAFDVPPATLVVRTEYEPAFLGRNEQRDRVRFRFRRCGFLCGRFHAYDLLRESITKKRRARKFSMVFSSFPSFLRG